MNLSPGPKEKLYIQKFYLYMNLTKPSELLYLSWAKVSGEGKALRPAYPIQDLMRLFPELVPVEEDRKGLLDHEMMRRNGLLQIAEGLREREHGLDDSWKELYRWFVKDEQSQETLKQMIEAGFYRKDEPSLGSRVAKELFLDPKRVSVTRLERFASCAYAHFLNYGLRLSEREKYGFEAMDLGNIAHQALERFARKAEEEAADEEKSERNTQRIPDDIVRLMEEMESENEDSEDEIYEEELEDGPGMDEDFIEGIEDELDGLDMNGSSFEEGDFDEADFEEEDLEGEDFDEADFEEEDLEGEDFDEGDFEEEDFDEEDFDEADFEEEDLDEEELEEADFDEDEDDFEDIDDEETDFDEGDFEEDMDEEDFDEEEIDDDEELDFGEDLEGEDFDEADFEEEDLDEGDFDEGDFEEEDFDEEEIEDEDDTEELEIEEPSEEEIQARIKKSKGGVPFDTGFVVTGRYDLSATSEIGLKAGLTEEQKKLFSYFVPVRGMSEQIVEVLDNDRRAQREGTSKTGNLLVIGRKGSGKTVLAVDIVKAIQKQRRLKQGKVAIVTGDSLNKKDIGSIIDKLNGGALIIEKASKMNDRTIRELNDMMDEQTGELLFLLEDQKKPLERMFASHREFKRKFTSRLELPVFINDELVTFGQTYAKENGYRIDEMGILALYSRIDMMQREDHAVTVAEVKEIMDEAISHSQKANVKHLVKRVFGRSTDNSDHIILKEEDFKA